MRRKVSKRKSKRIFTRTARRTHRMNLGNGMNMRGGIRL